MRLPGWLTRREYRITHAVRLSRLMWVVQGRAWWNTRWVDVAGPYEARGDAINQCIQRKREAR